MMSNQFQIIRARENETRVLRYPVRKDGTVSNSYRLIAIRKSVNGGAAIQDYVRVR